MARGILVARSILVLLVTASLGVAGEHRDAAGFSFSYPDDWVLVSKQTLGKVAPDVRNWVKVNGMDLSQVHCAVLHRSGDAFLESLNFVITAEQILVDENSRLELQDKIDKQYTKAGMKPENMQASLGKVGAADAIVLTFQSEHPGVPVPLRQSQFFLPSNGKTLIVTCTSGAQDAPTHAAIFEPILSTLQADPPAPPKGFDFSRVLTMAIAGGVAGGVIGGLMGIYNKFFKKKDDELGDI